MLSCRETIEWSNDFMDRSLPWRKRIEWKLHLLLCGHCRRYFRQLRAVAIAVRGLPARSLSDDSLRAQVEALKKL